MVMSTIETHSADTTCVNASISISKNMNKELHEHEQIMIGEFLDKAEDIAMSTTSIAVDYDGPEDDVSCESEPQCGNNPFSSITVDEVIVQEIIANDDRLHAEVDEFMNMYSMQIDEDEELDLDTFDFSAIMGSNE